MVVLALFIFACQDGITKYLAQEYSVMSLVTIRYWFFALFVICLSARNKGGISQTARTKMPKLQFARGVLLGMQVFLASYLFAELGLINTHVIFACYPLLITVFSIPLLGEKVRWQRWVAVIVGFIGIVIIYQPGTDFFSLLSLIPLFSSATYAIYNIMTRYVASVDSSETSFFWTGIGGAVAMTLFAPFFWSNPPMGMDWIWMSILCMTGAGGHYLVIKALAGAEASSLQPFSFFHLVFVSAIGLIIFDEKINLTLITGASIIVGAGLFTVWRERVRARHERNQSNHA